MARSFDTVSDAPVAAGTDVADKLSEDSLLHAWTEHIKEYLADVPLPPPVSSFLVSESLKENVAPDSNADTINTNEHLGASERKKTVHFADSPAKPSELKRKHDSFAVPYSLPSAPSVVSASPFSKPSSRPVLKVTTKTNQPAVAPVLSLCQPHITSFSLLLLRSNLGEEYPGMLLCHQSRAPM